MKTLKEIIEKKLTKMEDSNAYCKLQIEASISLLKHLCNLKDKRKFFNIIYKHINSEMDYYRLRVIISKELLVIVWLY